ncbi:M14 metallopeptidase family protein [Pseudoalteromonas mariniglutinosa]|uniref:M14 family metallopeptidase n=1 Tax=Pseudoalteromonas mariniglutinosa TaxID=206042 RepID=UPI00384E3204
MLKLFLATTIISSSFVSAHSIDTRVTPGFDNNIVKRSAITPLLAQFAAHPNVEMTRLGTSFLGQPIDALTIGKGPLKVMMWSQMHGDENTATAALMDFLDFITLPENANWLQNWQDKLTLKIIPMINPDGAQLQTRYNAQDIDLNRDAKALRTQEGQILMAAAKRFKPDFGFNLHDQNAYYGAGSQAKTATISVLAPAYNDARDINHSRGNAMKLIAQLSQMITQEIPGHLAKYNDSYSYRSFGDTFSEMGISTILIEAGAYPNDPHRQIARRVNRMLYVEMIDTLVSGSWQQQELATYQAIPFNKSDAWVDLLIDDIKVNTEHGSYHIDISINNKGRLAHINELGDISSIRQGFTQLDASQLTYESGKRFHINEPLTLTEQSYKAILKQGYSCFTGDLSSITNHSNWPMYPCNKQKPSPQRGAAAHFLLKDNNTVAYAVIGSKLISL